MIKKSDARSFRSKRQLSLFPEKRSVEETLLRLEASSVSQAQSLSRIATALEDLPSLLERRTPLTVRDLVMQLVTRLSDMTAMVEQLLASEKVAEVAREREIMGRTMVATVREGTRTGDARVMLEGEVASAHGAITLVRHLRQQGVIT